MIEPERMRAVLAQQEALRQITLHAGKVWCEYDITPRFGWWMARHRYADRYFSRPQRAATVLTDFATWLGQDIRAHIDEHALDANSLLVLSGGEALFGITKLSGIIREIEDHIPGRMVVLFPGQYQEPQYRLLDARDGWSYLAVPIVPISGNGPGRSVA
ncbi:MAG: hypothetical protein WBA46_01385 [Thermomicrobiales bacterium]